MSVRCSLGHENPDGSAFCDECGEPLSAGPAVAQAPVDQQVQAPPAAVSQPGTQTCPSCGSPNPEGEAFCSNCGSMLSGAPSAPTVTGTPAPVIAPAATGTPVPAMNSTAAPSMSTGHLIVEADNQEFDLSGKDNVMIGREDAVSNIFPDVDLTPHGGEEGGVSRLHARLFNENGQWMLEDENSTNFTFLNRQKLQPKTPTPLNDNDEVRLGRVLLRFRTA